MTHNRAKTIVMAALLVMAVHLMAGPAHAERIWWDGTREDADAPLPGKLLTENPGYWGPQVLTGVEYHYETEPDNPPDRDRGEDGTFGRRLLDGRAQGDWHVPVGVTGDPPVMRVVFDFKRPCVFNEVHLSTRSETLDITIEVREREDGPWREAFSRDIDQSPERMFHRLSMPAETEGRYLRLTLIGSRYHTYLDEVWVWGDAEVSEAYPEAIDPVASFAEHPDDDPAARYSIAGIRETAFTRAQLERWRERVRGVSDAQAVWSSLPMPEGELTFDGPILPEPARINASVDLTMARNERENHLLALTSASTSESLPLELQPVVFHGTGEREGVEADSIDAVVRVAGALPTAHEGGDIQLRPFFAADNRPDASLLRRYLANAGSVIDFPRLALAPGESAVLMLSVRTDDAAPGVYKAQLDAGAAEPLEVRLEVLDVTLPEPFAWVRSWSGVTDQAPFTSTARQRREVAYKQEMGITVWRGGFPTDGSLHAIAHQQGRALFRMRGLPGEFDRHEYADASEVEDIAPDDQAAIAQHVRALAEQARSLGLDYDQWFIEFWDEPGRDSAALYGVLARIAKRADPEVNIYMNPLFWKGGSGWTPEDEIHAWLAPFYNEFIDVSVPHQGLDDPSQRPKLYESLFDQPRWVRAYYIHPVTRGPRQGRGMSWRSFERGWNGWGYFAYYRPGGGSPWDITTWRRWPNYDYQMVFPGPAGAVPTLLSEAAREGWEDYRLLTLLKDQGREQTLAALMEAYEAGESLHELRLQALKAAAEAEAD